MRRTRLLRVETHAAQQQRWMGTVDHRVGTQREPLMVDVGQALAPRGFDLPGATQAEQCQVRRVSAPEEALPVRLVECQGIEGRCGARAHGDDGALVLQRELVRGVEHVQ
ncbi:hypothetical protein D3C84_1037070 [compost metagenome]